MVTLFSSHHISFIIPLVFSNFHMTSISPGFYLFLSVSKICIVRNLINRSLFSPACGPLSFTFLDYDLWEENFLILGHIFSFCGFVHFVAFMVAVSKAHFQLLLSIQYKSQSNKSSQIK